MRNQILFNSPPGANSIIHKLERYGYEAYFVGGCVRDAIAGRVPKDWDIATNAKPERIKALFEKTIDTGIKHGTVTVLSSDSKIEVTTYRVDGEYNDNRHPSEVNFVSSLKEDLSRRDFTMNAIAYHPERGLIDPFNGIESIEKKIIVAVGLAGKRFEEDALRMLRAIRFSAQLDFSLEDKLLNSIREKAHLIQKISIERITEELNSIIMSDSPMKFRLLQDTCLLKYIIPEFERCFHTSQNHPYHIYNVAIHSLEAVQNIEQEKDLRWTMLLHDIGKPLVKTTDEEGIDHFYGHDKKSFQLSQNILKRLKFSKNSTDRISNLIKHHGRMIETSYKAVRSCVSNLGEDMFYDLLKVKEADIKAQNPQFYIERHSQLNEINNIYREIKQENQCLSLKDLAINGKHLMAIGFKQGKEIGKILNELLELVIESPELNTEEKLIKIVYGRYD